MERSEAQRDREREDGRDHEEHGEEPPSRRGSGRQTRQRWQVGRSGHGRPSDGSPPRRNGTVPGPRE
ncbi:hypothetical protein GCM10009868_33210 [Terrabacter aerolatus]|uniref:Uncharacterized protein n=1 Tax=Terrabacter aerolatus TaxID=422442 RepID=A0A512CYF1_9MICO|nr:hypothetical protein TAE01_10450 [Terrabacter aerolatus]